MRGAGAVVTLVLVAWATGFVAGSAWTQSWSVVRRGHFRIVAWAALVLAAAGFAANRAALADGNLDGGAQPVLVGALVALCALYLGAQYVRTDHPGTVVGFGAGAAGALALVATGGLIEGWAQPLAALSLLGGAGLLGGVTNGMLLGHWYLNQPGLKPEALRRLTDATLAATGASGVIGIVGAPALATASTEGAVLGIPGFGADLGGAFYVVWLVLLAGTGGLVWMALRCVKIRSIQSATGLYYVALLTAGVAEFMVRYLMVNAT